jgi:hypothetical protein
MYSFVLILVMQIADCEMEGVTGGETTVEDHLLYFFT